MPDEYTLADFRDTLTPLQRSLVVTLYLAASSYLLATNSKPDPERLPIVGGRALAHILSVSNWGSYHRILMSELEDFGWLSVYKDTVTGKLSYRMTAAGWMFVNKRIVNSMSAIIAGEIIPF